MNKLKQDYEILNLSKRNILLYNTNYSTQAVSTRQKEEPVFPGKQKELSEQTARKSDGINTPRAFHHVTYNPHR